MNRQMEEVLALRMATGVSIPQATDALQKCENSKVAEEYLKMKLSGVVRYHLKPNGRKVAWQDADYIELANKIIKEKYGEQNT